MGATRRSLIVAILLLFMASGVVAQERQLLSRATLDSLVNPSLSKYADALTAKCTVVDLGEIDAVDRYTARFTLRNERAEDITITELRSTCSCLSVMTKPKLLARGEQLDIVAEFNPAGRSGGFKLDILVYTSLDEQRPTQRLSVVGSIKDNQRWSHLSESMGELRLSRKEVTLDGIKAGKRRAEHIVCANTSDRAIRISAHSTIDGLSLSCEPEVLPAGSEGEITISYLSDKPMGRELRTMLIVDGVGGNVKDRIIGITLQQ